MKKILSVFLIAILVFGSIPDCVFAAERQDQVFTQSNTNNAGYAYDSGGDPAGGIKLSYPDNFEFVEPSEDWVLANADQPANRFKDVRVEFQDNILIVDSAITEKIATAGQILAGGDIQKSPVSRIIAEGGYIDTEVLDEAAEEEGVEIVPGTIVLDKESMVAFKVDSQTIYNTTGDKNLDDRTEKLNRTYQISQPEMHEILKDFELGGSYPDGEPVEMTRGNIAGFAKTPDGKSIQECIVDRELQPEAVSVLYDMPANGTIVASKLGLADRSVEATQVAGGDYKYMTEGRSTLVDFAFKDQELVAISSGGTKFNVKVSGGLAISSIDVNAKWGAMSGYHLSVNAEEEMYLIIEAEVKIDEEFQIPIIALDIPFGVGRIQAGLYLVVGASGELTLRIEAREYMGFEAGIKGKTFLFVPTSFKPYFNKKVHLDGDIDIAGKIDIHVFLGPIMKLEILGIDLIGAGILLGVGLEVETDGEMLDVNLYAFFNIYVDLLGKHKDIVKWKPSLIRRKQKDTKKYSIKIMEAFLNLDRIGGTIKDATGMPNIPLENAPYTIFVIPKGVDLKTLDLENLETDLEIPTQRTNQYLTVKAFGGRYTTDEGEFYLYPEDMKAADKKDNPEPVLQAGDRIAVKIKTPRGIVVSDAMQVWLPFETINITGADAFNDFVTGNVDPVRVTVWEKHQTDVDGRWKADPLEQQYEYKNYANSTIYIEGMKCENFVELIYMEKDDDPDWYGTMNRIYAPGDQLSFNWNLHGISCTWTGRAEDVFANIETIEKQHRIELPITTQWAYTPTAIINPGGAVKVYTDASGRFDTSNRAKPQRPGKAGEDRLMPLGPENPPVYNDTLNVLPPMNHNYMYYSDERLDLRDERFEGGVQGGISAYFDLGDFDIDGCHFIGSQSFWIYPLINPFVVARTLERVEGSEEKVRDGRKIVDSMQFHETVFISNAIGTRTITEEDLKSFDILGFSTQDRTSGPGLFQDWKPPAERDFEYMKNEYKWHYDMTKNPVETKPLTPRGNLIPVTDENGDPTGTAALRRLVTAEWVWQPHPRPLVITPASEPVVRAGDSWILEGKGGIVPYQWTLLDAPEGLEISLVETTYSLLDIPSYDLEDTKKVSIDVPESFEPGEYTFTIRLEQEPGRFLSDLESGGKVYYEYGEKFNPDQPRHWTWAHGDPHGGYVMAMSSGLLAAVDPGNDPPPPVVKTFTITVTEAPAKPPTILDEPHGFLFVKPETGIYTTTVRAEGTEPISFSVDLPGNLNGLVFIGEYSGELTIRENIPPGTYYFAIRAENKAGYDIRSCTLGVEADVQVPVIPPTLLDDDHSFEFKTEQRMDFKFNIRASGTQPIRYYLSSLPGNLSNVKIDENTGVLFISGNIPSGSFVFDINAENSAGKDTRRCSLIVKAYIGGPYGVDDFAATILPTTFDAANKPVFTRLSAETTSDMDDDEEDGLGTIDMSMPWEEGGYEEVALICDHNTDNNAVYGWDNYSWHRFYLNGAEYLRWHSSATISFEGFNFKADLIDLSEGGDAYNFYSGSGGYDGKSTGKKWEPDEGELPEQEISWQPMQGRQTVKSANVDKSTFPDLTNFPVEEPSEEHKAMIQAMTENLDTLQGEYENAPEDPGIGIWINVPTIIDYKNREPRMSLEERRNNFGFFNYGDILDAMDADPNGMQIIDLEEINCTIVTGKLFERLAMHKKAGLMFIQPIAGATVTFMGADIKSADPEQLMNFRYASSAYNKDTILAAAADDENSFAYSFAYHGDLPGMAAFVVKTNYTQGTRVNIYKYDAESDAFTLIDKVAAGEDGVVEYRNNTMSEYIITTVTIGGAEEGGGGFNMLWIVFIILAAVAGGGGAYILIMRKKKQAKTE